MTLAHLKVIGVMSGGDLNDTGTELSVYISILNDRNHTVYDRKQYLSAMQMGITLIIGMDGYCGIT